MEKANPSEKKRRIARIFSPNGLHFWGVSLLLGWALFYAWPHALAPLGVRRLAIWQPWTYLVDTVWIMVLTIAYYQAWRRLPTMVISARSIFIWAAAFHLLLLPMLPLASADIYAYIQRGRVWSEYGENPYLTTYDQYPNDPLAPDIMSIASWQPMNYGPVFALLSGVVTKAAGNDLRLNIWCFKLIAISASLATAWLIFRISGARSLLAYAWNPLIIFEIAQNGHNDTLVALFLIAAFYALVGFRGRWRELASILLLFASIWMKYYTVVFLIPWLIEFKHQVGDLKAWLGRTGPALAAATVLTLGVFAPYWEGLGIFRTLVDQVVPHPSIFSAPLIIVFATAYDHLGSKHAIMMGEVTARLLFIFLYFWFIIYLWRHWQERRRYDYYALIYGAFIASFPGWVMPWYAIPLIAILALGESAPERWRRRSILAVTIYGSAYYLLLR